MNYNDFKEAVEGKRIICFGAGKNAAEVLRDVHILPNLDRIDCFVDNDADKHGTTIISGDYSFIVKSPECLIGKDDIVVLITAERYHEIAQQVEEITRGSIRWFSWSLMHARAELDRIFYGVSRSEINFVLINTPDYYNLGDHAIAMAERAFLKRNFKNRIIEIGSRLCHSGKEIIHEYINEKDVLLITGGGYMGTLWAGNEEVIRNIVRTFKNNHIIIFPQSVFYGDSDKDREDLEKSKMIYNSHKKLLICSREEISYQLMRKMYPMCGHYLIPDMVLSLNAPDTAKKVDRIGFCLRSDKECILEQPDRDRLYEAAASSGLDIVHITNHSSPDSGIAHDNSEPHVYAKLAEYRSCRLIVTDRLHGMVFAAITSTPCIVLDNSYHKNRGLYYTWLKDFDYITFVEDIKTMDAPRIIMELLAMLPRYYDNSVFAGFYLKLADYISRIEGVIRVD